METPSKSQAASSTPKREAPERETFRAGDLNRITGLTYRQVNDWDARVGALPHGDRSEAGWRKFSADEVLAVAVCAALRRDFGVPLEKLAWLQSHMLQERAPGYFQLATNMAKAGLAVFVVTDLVSEFIVDSDLNLRWMFEDGQFRSCEAKTHVMLRVNAILNSMWATAVQDFAEMKLNRKLYRKVLETEAHARAQNTAELELLLAARGKNVVSVKIIPGPKDSTIEVVHDLPVDSSLDAIITEYGYQDVVVKRQQGKNAKVVRTVRRKALRKPYLLVVQAEE